MCENNMCIHVENINLARGWGVCRLISIDE